MSHKSRTPQVQHLVPFHLNFLPPILRPGATDPRAKHQASAPSLPMSLPHKSMAVTVLLTFNASARACGQKRWQTMWNLRTYEAICNTNIQPCPPPKIWSQDHESKSRWILAQTRYGLILVLDFSLALQVSEHPPPSHFHLVSIPSEWLFWKDAQAQHLSNSTKVSQVSNKHHWYTTWFHFISPFRGLEPQTPVPSTRPWLLHCQFHCHPSRCSSKSCWLSMLRQGPADKNDGKPCQTWELTNAICDNIQPCPVQYTIQFHKQLKKI